MAAAFSRRFLASALLALALLGTSGCSSLKFWDKDKGDKVIEGSPEQLYRDAIDDIKNNNYPGAIQRYEMLEARYPFSEQAKQGQLDLIYAYYKNRSIESAIDQADQFVRENPTASARRLRLLHSRARVLRVGSQLARTQVQGGHCQATAPRSAQVVPGLPDCSCSSTRRARTRPMRANA